MPSFVHSSSSSTTFMGDRTRNRLPKFGRSQKVQRNGIAKCLSYANRLLIYLSKGLFSYQIYLKLKPRPDLNLLLGNAQELASTLAEASTGEAT